MESQESTGLRLGLWTYTGLLSNLGLDLGKSPDCLLIFEINYGNRYVVTVNEGNICKSPSTVLGLY